MRRLIGFAVALLALVALSGCGIERLTGPQVDAASLNRTGSTYAPSRDDDPKDPPPVDGGGSIGSASDSLRTGDDGAR